jgi:hypothetical protein
LTGAAGTPKKVNVINLKEYHAVIPAVNVPKTQAIYPLTV